MENNKPVDYQAIIDSMRREEHKPDNPVRTTEIPYIQTKTGKHVDYQKASDDWEKEQAGKYTLYVSEENQEGMRDKSASLLKTYTSLQISFSSFIQYRTYTTKNEGRHAAMPLHVRTTFFN